MKLPLRESTSGCGRLAAGPFFVRIAEDELTRLERRAGTGRRLVAAPFDHRLRQPIAIAEVIVGVIKWRRRVQVQRREHFDTLALRDEFFVFAHGSARVPLRRGRTGSRSRASLGWPDLRPSDLDDSLRCRRASAARATIPCLNSSGNVASEASSTPSARNPFQVKATVTQRFSLSTEARIAAADCTFSKMAASHLRPPAATAK